MKERILKLLINGLKAAEVASIVGCSQAYISQLLKDNNFREELRQGMMLVQAERTEEEHIEAKYQNLEYKILGSIEESLGEASLGEKVRALEAINKRSDARHARRNPIPQGPQLQLNVVSLQLPQHAMAKIEPVIQMNSQSEIVAIDNMHLAPMSADGVKNLFEQITQAKRDPQAILAEI